MTFSKEELEGQTSANPPKEKKKKEKRRRIVLYPSLTASFEAIVVKVTITEAAGLREK